MSQSGLSHIQYEPDPEHPGWHTWNVADSTRFNAAVMGKLLVRRESDSQVRLRMFPIRHHANLHDKLHGGVTLALIDIALFAASRIIADVDAAGSVTLELSNQFIGSGALDKPVDAVTEVLRETGRLVFLRGLVMQEDHLIASFTGTIRKPGRPKP